VRVVADSQAIYWYLTRPERLSERALEALGECENTDGIVVSAWTVPELWMGATRKRGERSVPRGNYELVRGVLVDPTIAIDVEPFGPAMWPHFEVVSLVLADPFDSAIVATARALGVGLVSSDQAVASSGVVEVIW
jgi:PIN domain nuclease of toxin-antitoxin system